MARPVLRGVVFDMDGTLTVPNLDFALMYKRCNVPMSEDILKAVDRMPKEEKHAAWRVIDAMEEEGVSTGRGCWEHKVVDNSAWIKRLKFCEWIDYEIELWIVDSNAWFCYS